MLVYGLQVKLLAERMIKWLKVGGYIFFRESCFQDSENSDKKHDVSYHREPRFYSKVCLFKLQLLNDLHFNGLCAFNNTV